MLSHLRLVVSVGVVENEYSPNPDSGYNEIFKPNFKTE